MEADRENSIHKGYSVLEGTVPSLLKTVDDDAQDFLCSRRSSSERGPHHGLVDDIRCTLAYMLSAGAVGFSSALLWCVAASGLTMPTSIAIAFPKVQCST